MKNNIASVALAPKLVEQDCALSNHRYSIFIEKFIKEELGLPPRLVRRAVDESIIWSFVNSITKLSVKFALYLGPKSEVFFYLEVALGTVVTKNDKQLCLELLAQNCTHYFPLWYALNDSALVLQCRGYADGFTDEHFNIRLRTIIQYAEQTKEWLDKRNFTGLPSDWFVSPLLN